MGRTYNLWVLVEPAEDVEGAWVAHCLEVDVISQGTSPSDALRMVAEAVVMTVEDDLRCKRDPFARRAPQQFWDRLYMVVKQGVPFRVSADDLRHHSIATQMQLEVIDHHPSFETPFAFTQRDSHPC